MLYASHDRYFVNRTATRILELTEQMFVNYIGNYDYYLEKKDHLTEVARNTRGAHGRTPAAAPEKPAEPTGVQDWKAQKEEQARKRKRENDIKKAEDAIAALEAREAEIDELLTQGGNLHRRLPPAPPQSGGRSRFRKELMEWMERWETLLEE